jgi:hypothetical protein
MFGAHSHRFDFLMISGSAVISGDLQHLQEITLRST